MLEAGIDKGVHGLHGLHGLHGRLLLNRGECRERAGGERMDRGWLIGSGRAVLGVIRSSVESQGSVYNSVVFHFAQNKTRR
jgi:hypothetical protein